MDIVIAGGLILIILVLAALAYRVRNSKIDPQVVATPAAQPAVPVATEKSITQICPWCKAEIPADAFTCMHCGRDVNKRMLQAKMFGQIGKLLWLVFLLGGILLCALTGGFGLLF